MLTHPTTELSHTETLLDRASTGVLVLDRLWRIAFANRGCEHLTGCPRSELTGRAYDQIVATACRGLDSSVRQAEPTPRRSDADKDRRLIQRTIRLRQTTGRILSAQETLIPMRGGDGQLECTIGLLYECSAGDNHPFRSTIDSANRPMDAWGTIARPVPLPVPEGSSAGPAAALDGMNLDRALRNVERNVIRRALRESGWHRNRAADLMNISRSRLYRRMEALGIDPNDHS